jgi:hypothetical protein
VDTDISREYTGSVVRDELQELAFFYGQVTRNAIVNPKKE